MGLEVAVVTFEAPAVAEMYARDTGLPWPLLLDPSRDLYRAYGMLRGRWAAIFGPGSWGVYLSLMRRGRRIHAPTGDIYQLGGDVLIAPDGRVALLHRGSGPADRPEPEDILELVRAAEGG